MVKRFYVTAAIPYVNAKPHIGHALEFIEVDVIARYHRLLGEDLLALSGGDENALKNVQAAEIAGVEVQKFVDQNNQLFFDLAKTLNVQFGVWQKGSDQKTHFSSSQKLWELCAKKGDIYKKKYKGLYCVGCETFYDPEELDEKGECFEHPGKKLEEVEEENYFFRLSKYQNAILQLLESNEYEIISESRRNEVLAFVKRGLNDLSISRSNERAKNWGVPVPGDSTQKMYVWFDALNIYQSGVGFGWDEEKYKKWWPADLHVVGKGIVRFHAVYWPAFLMSAGLPLPKKLFVHEYFTVNGQKMSKTVGNVYDPLPIIKRLGTDPLRYYCLAKISPFKDGDFSEEKLLAAYEADLSKGLGNLVSRVSKLCETSGFTFVEDEPPGFRSVVKSQLETYRFDLALTAIWNKIGDVDKQIDTTTPWKLNGRDLKTVLFELVAHLRQIGYELQPFMPQTAKKILEIFRGPRIVAPAPLFPRL